MADRIFKGCLTPEAHDAFPESAPTFDTAHAGGLVPFEMFQEVLGLTEEAVLGDERMRVEMIAGSIWLGRGDLWIKIDSDGSIEVGASGV